MIIVGFLMGQLWETLTRLTSEREELPSCSY